MPTKYRSKSLTIEAVQFDDGRISVIDVGSFHDNYEAVE